MKEITNKVNLLRLMPAVKNHAKIYEIEDQEINHDYNDGRILVNGIMYRAVSYRLSLDDYEFVGYVNEYELDVVPNPHTYKIELNNRSFGGYTPNIDLYYDYDDYIFQASNDDEAISIANELQEQIEQQTIECGNDLHDNDPVLAHNLIKFSYWDENGYSEWTEVVL